MAKKVTSRKRTVIQEIHPNIADRVEEFTDPERIAAARERLVDYGKVAKQFAASSDLPDDDLDDDDSVATATVTSNGIPAGRATSKDDEDLVAFLNDDTSKDEQPANRSASVFDDENDTLDDDISDDDDGFISINAPTETVRPAAARPVSIDLEDDNDFDVDDLDTDLMSDTDTSRAGDNAFGPIGGADDDDDDGIFGLPNVAQEPTPYGNQNANGKSRNAFDDDLDEDEIVRPSWNKSTKEDKDDLPSWMVEDGDDDDDEIEDALASIPTRAADIDDNEGLFDEGREKRTSRVTKTPSSTASLEDVMGITNGDEDVKVPETEVVSEDVVVANNEPAKKKGLFSGFGRKKHNARTHEHPVEAVVVTPAPKKEKKGLFGRKKVVVEKTEETNILGDEKVMTQVVSEEDIENGQEVIKQTTTKKKSKPLLKAAAITLAIGALSGVGYFTADQLGYLGQAPVAVQVKPKTSTDSAVNPILPKNNSSSSPDKVTPPLNTPVNDNTSSTPSGDDLLTLPDVADTPATTGNETVTPNDDNAVITPENIDGDLSLVLPEDTITSPETVSVDNVKVITSGVLDLINGAPVAIGPSTDTAKTDGFDELYGAGRSEEQLEAADQKLALDRVVELGKLLDGQKRSLDSALERVKALENVIAEKDQVIAQAQSEANEAQSSAKEAKEMAMAQNDVLIEVVGIQDKMKIAEELIVDLSKRTAAIETDDSDTQKIEQLNEQIKDLTRNIGLLSRTVMTNGRNLDMQRDSQAAADRAHDEAQAAVDAEAEATMDKQTQDAPAGSSAVYDNEKKLLTTPTRQDGVDIPDDVKVGDELPVYGKVLDISPTEDGGKLITMENSSKIIPRKE